VATPSVTRPMMTHTATLGPVSVAALLADFLAPGKPSWSTVFGDWTVDPVFVLTLLAGALYVSGVRRLAARGRSWPVGRSVAFGSGLVLIAFATQSGFAQYDRVLFSLHVAQHLLLGMIAPVLLVLGAPVTLALQAGHRSAQTRGLQVLHSRPVAVVTHPLVVWILFGGTLVVLYFTGLYELSLRNAWVHGFLHVHFIVVGCLFMAYVIGVDPMPRSFGYGARLLFVAVVLPFHAFLGVALLGRRTVLAADWYAHVSRPWVSSGLSDQKVGAGMLWAFGELFGLVALGIVLYQWMRHEELVAARADRRLDAERADARGSGISTRA
jgi:cytochrome c oxidase assembly factor CtaG